MKPRLEAPSPLILGTPALRNNHILYSEVLRSLHLAGLGKHDEAMSLLQGARAGARRARRPDIEAQILSTISLQAFLKFDTSESLRAANAIVELATAGPLEESAARAIAFRGNLALARYYSQLGLDRQSRAALEKAEEASLIDSPAQLCGFLELRATDESRLGNPGAAAMFDQLLDISSRRDSADNYAVRLSCAANAAMTSGLAERSLRLYEVSLGRAALFGAHGRLHENIALEYAWMALSAGEFAIAADLFTRSQSLDESLCVRVYRAAVATMLGVLAADQSPAREPDAGVFALARKSGIPNQIGPMAAALHAFYVSGGNRDAAAGVLSKALASLVSADGCWWLLLQVAVHGRLEDVHAALVLLRPYDDQFRLAKAHRLLLRARLAADDGRADDSERIAWEASLLFGELGWRYHRAIALHMAGRQALARELLAKIGVGQSAALAPRSGRRRTRSAYHVTLSEIDDEIVRLVCQNATNRGIGETLGMSERAVKYHLTEIFAAYGVRNRRELADSARNGFSVP